MENKKELLNSYKDDSITIIIDISISDIQNMHHSYTVYLDNDSDASSPYTTIKSQLIDGKYIVNTTAKCKLNDIIRVLFDGTHQSLVDISDEILLQDVSMQRLLFGTPTDLRYIVTGLNPIFKYHWK